MKDRYLTVEHIAGRFRRIVTIVHERKPRTFGMTSPRDRVDMRHASSAPSCMTPVKEHSEREKRLQLQSRPEQGRTELGVSERILAILFRTPEDLSSNLLSSLGGVDRTSPIFALGILHILSDVKLGAEKSRLDQEVSLESRVHYSNSGGFARQPNETKGRINRGIREANVERGVAGESVDGEFSTSMVLSGSEEGNVTEDRAVRGFDEELGEISKLILFVVGLSRVVCESDVGSDGRVPGLEHQKLSGGEVSNDDVILGPKLTTVNAQSL
jgi:hypothetical protein